MEKKLRLTLVKGCFAGTPAARSTAMARIKHRNNKSTEIPLRMALVRARLSGWRANYKLITGCPDFFFERRKLVVFVDGCFWHGCPRCGHIPKSNGRFWATKIKLNKRRDKKTANALRAQGYRVLRIWEHEITFSLEDCLKRVFKCL